MHEECPNNELIHYFVFVLNDAHLTLTHLPVHKYPLILNDRHTASHDITSCAGGRHNMPPPPAS